MNQQRIERESGCPSERGSVEKRKMGKHWDFPFRFPVVFPVHFLPFSLAHFHSFLGG
jgi:hypothetical protein